MRYQGKITSWKDDQGFGFVTQNGGGDRAFVHIKAFASRTRRPVEGDLITYEQSIDEKRRLRADNIRFVGDRTSSATPHKTSSFGPVFATLFCLVVIATVLRGRLPLAILGLYAAASCITFIAYAIDKSSAQNNRWRTQESTLHLFGLVGGWPGALLAQKLLRHKSKKEEFQTVYWVTVVINCGAFGWLCTENGALIVRSVLGSA